MTLFWILCSISCSLPIFGVNNMATSASRWNSQRVHARLIVRGEHDKMTKKKISLSIIMVVAAVDVVMKEAYQNLIQNWREKWVSHIMAQLFLLCLVRMERNYPSTWIWFFIIARARRSTSVRLWKSWKWISPEAQTTEPVQPPYLWDAMRSLHFSFHAILFFSRRKLFLFVRFSFTMSVVVFVCVLFAFLFVYFWTTEMKLLHT